MKPRRRWIALLLAASVLPATLPAQGPSEYEVKAAFLFNFTRFVDWPSAGAGPFCIGILGADPFGGALEEAVKGRMVGSRAIKIKRFKQGDEPSGCEIIFVSGADSQKTAAILARLKGLMALTVGETPGFCSKGGAIGFAVQNSKVTLEVNPDAALRARLQISSKLLSLATLVREVGN